VISQYLNDTAVLKRSTAVAADGSHTYTTTTIPCRFEPKNRWLQTKIGELVTSTARIFTTSEVLISDVIAYGGRDWQVRAVYARRGLSEISHYEVYL